jgi:hypothetical protein
MQPSNLNTALAYRQAGLSLIPCATKTKQPLFDLLPRDSDNKATWEPFKQCIADESTIRTFFHNGAAIAIICGAVSGNLECLDIDNKIGNADSLYTEWRAMVDDNMPGLVDRLVIERTQSGGYHFWYRCAVIEGPQKLARSLDSAGKAQTIFETKGDGGYVLCSPTPGYVLIQGDLEHPPTITPDERAMLLLVARIQNTHTDESRIESGYSTPAGTGLRPGDDYNQRIDANEFQQLIERHGWRLVYSRGENDYYMRPDKTRGSIGASWHRSKRVWYVFTSSSEFEPDRGYSAFSVYTKLAHGNSAKDAARELGKSGYGDKAHTPQNDVRSATKPTEKPSKANDTKTLEYNAAPAIPPIDVNDLLIMERRDVLWFAPNFLREGLGLLVGQPNVGKTPLAAQLAIAIATGAKWMNMIQCPQAKVLYLGMEYSTQELIPLFDISRMGQKIPRDCLAIKTIEDDFPTTADQALEQLEYYMRDLGFRVIIIDVLTAFLPPEKFKQNIYRGDYSELKPYHRLALKYNACILGVWHASKRESDPKLMYNGSTGMWAACASRITMYMDADQRVRLASYPRMGDKVEWGLSQESNKWGKRWIVADANPEPVCSPTELSIYRCLRQYADKSRPFAAQSVADMTGVDIRTVRTLLPRMAEKNLVHKSRSGDGYYVEIVVAVVADVASVVDVADVASQYVATDVATALLKNDDLDSGFTRSESEQILFRNTKQQEQRDSTDNNKNDVATSPNPDDIHPIWSMVPRYALTGFRLYLRSNMPADQERAKQLCIEYGIDYEAAYKEVRITTPADT